jgi:potassium-dependent mechanosensitive channel
LRVFIPSLVPPCFAMNRIYRLAKRLPWSLGAGCALGILHQTHALSQTSANSNPAPFFLPPLLADVIEAILIVAGAVLGDWLLRQIWRRRRPKPKASASATSNWVDFCLDLGRQGCHWLLWLGTVILLIWQVSFLAHAQIGLQYLWILVEGGVRNILYMPLFKLGKESITLTKLFLFLGISLAILILSKVFSTWLKRVILSRLGIERGSQEAIASVVGYLLAALGMVIVLQTVGIDLSSLAVVAGVLGIGVGFGLQLLTSNFISGVVILLEQPIHVGDFIEVDGLLGTVEKISFRSTTIRTNDSLVVIIPNNRFLEKHVINRSYRNTDTRLHIPVSVAIGSDMALVTEALLAAARQDSRVLAAPAPTVRFNRFGEGAFEMALLVWINQPQEFEVISSALNFLIEQEFSLRRIEIPLPQQELRLRHPQELLPLFNPDWGKQEASSASLQTTPSSRQNLRDLLRQVVYFQNCSDVELRILIEQGYQKIFAANSCIFREQDPGDAFYIILAGKVEVFSQKLNQKIATLGVGEFFGEISLLTGVPRSATVTTTTVTTLFIVDQAALQKLLQEHQPLAEQIAQTLSQRQNILQELGILPGQTSTANPTAEEPLIWIRQRFKTLFGI